MPARGNPQRGGPPQSRRGWCFDIKYFIVVKLPHKPVFLLLVLSIAALLFYWHYKTPRLVPAQAVLPLTGLVFAIDPGHGGYDPGAKGYGLVEKDVVLEIGFFLRDYLQQGGARVIMTRDRDKDFLAAAGPKKRLDMSNRLRIVEEEGADLLVSIHANYISSSRWQGSQVFYQEGSSGGKALAECIQAELTRVLKNTNRQAKSGNFFMLRESSMPGVVVEVGFISNPQEAELLGKPKYQMKMAWAIYLGIIAFLTAP
ncbi:MAG: N-acetylmuramoyl-L-alanine amidase [Bacillota bacterium]